MANVLKDLNPTLVFKYFEEISQVPRGSGDEEKISEFLVNFAKELNLEVVQDEHLNVIIRKPATAGYENCPGVIYKDIWIWFVKKIKMLTMISKRIQ